MAMAMASRQASRQGAADKRQLQRMTAPERLPTFGTDTTATRLLEEGQRPAHEGEQGAQAASDVGLVLLTCLLSAAESTAIATLALPRLWGLTKVGFSLQLAVSALGGATGALVIAVETGLWDKMQRFVVLKVVIMMGLVGLLGATPFVIAAAAVTAWLGQDASLVVQCKQASEWMASAQLLSLIPTILLQACFAASSDSALWICVLLSFLVVTNAAFRHDSVEHTYRKVLFIETAFDAKWESAVPLITGTVESFMSVDGALLLVFRGCEIAASTAGYALFHVGTAGLIAVGGADLGGLVLLAIEWGWHCAALWMTAGTIGDALTLMTSCVFIPRPLLREGTAAAVPYGVKFAVQVLVLLAVLLIVTGRAATSAWELLYTWAVSACLMWPMFFAVRSMMAKPAVVSKDAKELAEKMKFGSAKIQPLKVSGEDRQDPQLLSFCQAFASHYYEDKFEVKNGAARLDLTGEKLAAGAGLSALYLIEPLITDVTSYELDVDGAEVGDAGIQLLGEHLPQHLLSLEANLGGTQMGDEGFASFCRGLPPTLMRLEAGINSTRVGDQGLAALGYHLPLSLKDLAVILYNTQVGDQGLAVLASRLPRGLQSCRAGLFNTKVGDAGVMALAEGLPIGLTTLKAELSGTKVTDQGAVALAEKLPKGLKSFEVNVDRTMVSDRGREQLEKAVPETIPKEGIIITPRRPVAAAAAATVSSATSWLSFGCV